MVEMLKNSAAELQVDALAIPGGLHHREIRGVKRGPITVFRPAVAEGPP